MAGYAYIENDKIKEIHYFLPQNWRNISNLDAMSEEELRSVNWYPILDQCPEYDPVYKQVSDVRIVYQDGEVVRIYDLSDIVREETIVEYIPPEISPDTNPSVEE